MLISNVSGAAFGKIIFICKGVTNHCATQMIYFRWKMSVKSNYTRLWDNAFVLFSLFFSAEVNIVISNFIISYI